LLELVGEIGRGGGCVEVEGEEEQQRGEADHLNSLAKVGADAGGLSHEGAVLTHPTIFVLGGVLFVSDCTVGGYGSVWGVLTIENSRCVMFAGHGPTPRGSCGLEVGRFFLMPVPD
jgi:hypothetical protein